jgi:predicted nucleic acid-binding protein
MIVADTNLITYLLMEGPMLPLAEGVFRHDPEWLAPALWRSEFRNVLTGFVRRGQLSAGGAVAYWQQAESLIHTADAESSSTILQLAIRSGCTAYDCEFVALAQHFTIPLVTADRQVLNAFPGIAVSPQDFLDR